jgi:hypothetical protein
VVFGGSGLIRGGGFWWKWPYMREWPLVGVAFGGSGLIRGVAFVGSGLI